MSRIAIVTGAAAGIGRAIAHVLARDGATVIVSDINAERGQVVAEEVGGRFVRADVTEEAEVQALIASAYAEEGRLDVLVNNAGIEGPVVPTHETTGDEFRQVFDVNVFGVFYGMRHALPRMVGQGGGIILNVASVAGLGGFPLHAAYSASKHAVVGLTRTAALEYAARGVRINALCPGFTDTEMVAGGLEKMNQTPEQLTGRIPMRRLATAEEIAEAARYLCAPSSGYVTGHALAVDGGIQAA